MCRTMLIRSFLVGLLLLGSGLGPHAISRSDQSSDGNLRDIFFDPGIDPHARAVGQLGITLLRPDSLETVGLQHKFRSGDRFRFDITSSQDGWLYILHSSPGGEHGQLWPRPGQQAHVVKAGVNYMVPPSPGNFRFEQNTGDEIFYVAIRSASVPPSLDAMSRPAAITVSAPSENRIDGSARQKIIDFDVRDPFGGGQIRTVVFESGEEDETDDYIYFSSGSDGDNSSATIVFKLRHSE